MQRRVMILGATLFWMLGACGGGGGAPAADIALRVSVLFPPTGGVTDQETILVNGTAAADAAINGVAVNDIEATSDDQFATWQVRVPLNRGANDFVVAVRAVRDGDDHTANTAIMVERTDPAFRNPVGVALDKTRGRLLVVESDRLLAVDLVTGARSVLPLTGVALLNAGRIAIRDDGREAYIGGLGSIFRVDLESGATDIATAKGIGTGASFSNVAGVRFDSATTQFIASDRTGSGGVFSVDGATAERTTLTGVGFKAMHDFVIDGVGNRLIAVGETVTAWDLDTAVATTLSTDAAGTDMRGLAWDAARSVLFGVDQNTGYVLEWSAITGIRRVLSGDGQDGPRLVAPRGMVFERDRNRLLLTDEGLDATVAIDVGTGHRSILSGVRAGTGPDLDNIRELVRSPDGRTFALKSNGDIVFIEGNTRTLIQNVRAAPHTVVGSMLFDATHDRLIVSVLTGPSLLAVDPASGNVTTLSDGTRGSGPLLVRPDRIAFDGQYALVMDIALKAIVRVDLQTGDRTVFSGAEAGSGPALESLWCLDASATTGELLVNDLGRGYVSIDPQTGNRDLVAEARSFLPDLAIDVVGRRAFQVGSGELICIDLRSGELTEVRTRGPALDNPLTVLYDEARHVVLVGDRATASVMAISPDTGERVIVVK